MEMIKQLKSKRFGCRPYTMALFKCSCGKEVKKIKRDGLRAKHCSHECYAKNRKKRGAYNPDKKILSKKYLYVHMPEHPHAIGTRKLYIAEHRLVMEVFLGRYLTKDEVVHHIDEDTLNNNISNLQLMTASEHSSLHANKRAKLKKQSKS